MPSPLTHGRGLLGRAFPTNTRQEAPLGCAFPHQHQHTATTTLSRPNMTWSYSIHVTFAAAIPMPHALPTNSTLAPTHHFFLLSSTRAVTTLAQRRNRGSPADLVRVDRGGRIPQVIIGPRTWPEQIIVSSRRAIIAVKTHILHSGGAHCTSQCNHIFQRICCEINGITRQ